MKIILRDILEKDLEKYLELNHPDKKFHKFNGPYFKHKTFEELKIYVESLREKINSGAEKILENSKLVADENDNLIGEVNLYWKSEETLWMEVGIVIFDENSWGKGIGYEAMKLWLKEKFKENPKLVRLGISTWSGNIGMMKLAEKLGMKKEAEYRKARIVEGKYYDSVSYGILREEFEKQ